MNFQILKIVLLGAATCLPVGAKKKSSAESLFVEWDSDKDGSLTKAELSELHRSSFEWADFDEDGKMSQWECSSYLKVYQRMLEGRARLPEKTRVIENLEYVEDGHVRQRLDLYLPAKEKRAKPMPLVIWVHGGGWKQGNKEVLVGQGCLLENGFALASINYRLTSHAHFPAQMHDCRAAIRYLRKHATEYGYDADKIGVWGGSAGGHLVAMLGTTNGMKELEGDLGVSGVSSSVQAVCAYYGPSNLLTQGALPGRPGKETPAETIGKFLGGAFESKKELAKLASPIEHVSKDDPPFLLMHGDADPIVPVSQSTTLHEKLKEFGVQSELHIVPGAGHAFFEEAEQLELIVSFFQSTLKD